MRSKCVLALSLIAIFSAPARPASVVTVRGELTCEGCNSYRDLLVEMRQAGGGPVVERTSVRPNGDFEFTGMRRGNYVVAVVNTRGDILKSETVVVGNYPPPISIALPEIKKENTARGSISFKRLAHKVPKQARKEFDKADKRLRDGDVDGSILHLKRATEIDPEYVEALNNLGCRYITKNDPANAAAVLRKAVEVDENAPLVHGNLAVALLALKEYDAAEQAARRAADMDGSDMKAKYVLALSLYAQRKFTGETVALLRKCEAVAPNASLALAATLAARGEREQAHAEITDYLRSPRDPQKRAEAEKLLLSLR